MVIRVASTSRLPNTIANTITMPVKIMALRGSLVLVRRAKVSDIGTVPCSARAWRIRGEPRMLPKAEEKVAARIPISTRKP